MRTWWNIQVVLVDPTSTPFSRCTTSAIGTLPILSGTTSSRRIQARWDMRGDTFLKAFLTEHEKLHLHAHLCTFWPTDPRSIKVVHICGMYARSSGCLINTAVTHFWERLTPYITWKQSEIVPKLFVMAGPESRKGWHSRPPRPWARPRETPSPSTPRSTVQV